MGPGRCAIGSADVTPAAEVEIDEALVRGLLEDQHPDLADRSLEFVSSGFDNVTFRVGDDLAARLPRRALAVDLLANEQQWLPKVGPSLPVPVPIPVRVGHATEAYPYPWSIVAWVPGSIVEHHPLGPRGASELGHALRILHGLDVPDDAPRSPYRGGPLADRAPALVDRATRLGLTDALDAWAAWSAAPPSGRTVWLHADLHPRNVLSRDGRLAGLLDWGDLCAGDPANDLDAPWLLLPVEHHDAFWAAYGAIDHATEVRARSWALYIAVTLIDAGMKDDPGFVAMGRVALDRLLR